jgi:hypothetical protein
MTNINSESEARLKGKVPGEADVSSPSDKPQEPPSEFEKAEARLI